MLISKVVHVCRVKTWKTEKLMKVNRNPVAQRMAECFIYFHSSIFFHSLFEVCMIVCV